MRKVSTDRVPGALELRLYSGTEVLSIVTVFIESNVLHSDCGFWNCLVTSKTITGRNCLNWS